ncbi:MAG: thiamine pyrophosphate-binding protein [Gammaproteobacteria bacterium]|nr:thiamine pyrophosphate-binding protein [Gammaproteobacteria bacterium]
MKIPVSELIVRFIERLGIEHIFGMPGAHILPVYDSLYDSSVISVLAKHEQGAAFMAGGYARASGKIGACITTAGPGATNLVTGIANAYADKQPVLIITGETSTHIFGKGGLQESSGEGGSIDQVSLFKGITKYNRVVERTDYLQNVLNRAAKILLSDSSGPVLLSFPYNVQKELVEESILDSIKTEKTAAEHHEGSQPVKAFAELLVAAERPVIIAGYGCIKSGAQDLVAELSESMHIPVTTSLKGKGTISEQSELSLGSLGVTSYSNAYDYIINKSDLIIMLGAGFNERTSYVWQDELLANKKIVQVDNNFEQLEKVFTADVAINGDIKSVLQGVLQQIKQLDAQQKNIDGILQEYRELDDKVSDHDVEVFLSQFPLVKTFFARLEQYIPDDAMVFDDNIIFAQNFFKVSSNNRYYPNSGVSSLGHAIPAAIGARFAENKHAFAVIGDGGFQMCCMELMTAVNYAIPLTVIMFNNSTMGLIRKNQYQQYDKRFINCDFINPDYQQLASSFGIEYKRVETEADIDDLFRKNNFSHTINLVEMMIDKDTFPTYSSRR